MTFESYTVKNGEKLRKGFTTGSAAAGAAKAAVLSLFQGEDPDSITISTPKGAELKLEPRFHDSTKGTVIAGVVKDAGDDPDITDGLEIRAKVETAESGEFILEGGRGVGLVTKPGLPVEKGKAAINPVPREMIKREVEEVLPADRGVRVTIEIPEGESVAEDTFNPKLGIEGGLSVLGTTGIVEPMSEDSYKRSLAAELSQTVALGETEIVMVFGNSGEKTAKKSGFSSESIVRMSNFVGYMLDQTSGLEVETVTLFGHIGKIVKVAGGIFNTHSKVADARLEILAGIAAYCGAVRPLIGEIFDANTAEQAAGRLLENEFAEVFEELADRVVERAEERLGGEVKAKSVIFSHNSGILGCSGLNCEEGVFESE
ncbi:MAG: cobalt-precorrin-5B (C(1))-methyltransferase CbiD [Candidatus Bipolaricaulota bacterium]|nr:cobalamin biosynthesis protein CbiD [Candidatus Bipolaricaulota bacterium]